MRNSMIWPAAMLAIFFVSCQGSERKQSAAKQGAGVDGDPVMEYILPEDPFDAVEASYSTDSLILPEGFTAQILFEATRDSVLRADGKRFPAKGLHDMCVAIPRGDGRYCMYVSHESRASHPDLGDGGGATVFEAMVDSNGQYSVVGPFHHIDFSGVGGTLRNCGGSLTPNGTVFTCEEAWSVNTASIYRNGRGITDTSEFLGRPRWQNFGFMVEVDPLQRKVLRKLYHMGKFMHEDVHFYDDTTIFMTDDYTPAVFFKYILDQPNDYGSGTLYAFKEGPRGGKGQWLKLPNDSTTWYNARDTAIARGATMYVRHEWITEVNGMLYITETGDDNFSLAKHMRAGGQPAHYLRKGRSSRDSTFDDVHGRILAFDPKQDLMYVYLDGGMIDQSNAFSNPDCITSVSLGDKDFLVLHEDINGANRGRVPKSAEGKFYNEIFFLEIGGHTPTLLDLRRFAVIPFGAESTGGYFSPDGDTFFFNIMHPRSTNRPPYDKAMTVAVAGFRRRLVEKSDNQDNPK